MRVIPHLEDVYFNFDMKLFHRPSRDQHIGIADGLSRIPTLLTSSVSSEFSEMLAMPVREAQASEAVSRIYWPTRTKGSGLAFRSSQSFVQDIAVPSPVFRASLVSSRSQQLRIPSSLAPSRLPFLRPSRHLKPCSQALFKYSPTPQSFYPFQPIAYIYTPPFGRK